MESNDQPNPHYSKSDSTKVNLSNAEWNKILPKEVYANC